MKIVEGSQIGVCHNYIIGAFVVDGKEVHPNIRATTVFRKENGQWRKVISHHTDLMHWLEVEVN